MDLTYIFVSGAFAAFCAAVVALIGYLVRQLDTARSREMERRLGEHDARIADLSAQIREHEQRLHADELDTTRLAGDVNLLRENHAGLDTDLRELRAEMARGFADLGARLDRIAAMRSGGALGASSASPLPAERAR